MLLVALNSKQPFLGVHGLREGHSLHRTEVIIFVNHIHLTAIKQICKESLTHKSTLLLLMGHLLMLYYVHAHFNISIIRM